MLRTKRFAQLPLRGDGRLFGAWKLGDETVNKWDAVTGLARDAKGERVM